MIAGELLIFVAFDWGDAIDLERARRLVSASELALARRRRTPISFSFNPAPLHVALSPVPLRLAEIGEVQASAAVTFFDFAAVSLALRVPFELDQPALLRLAQSLAEPSELLQSARNALRPLFAQIKPAIQDPAWQDDLSEEYFVFHLPPGGDRVEDAWLAGVVHLENGPLSTDEVAEALRLRLSYSPDDLFIPNWAAAVLIDRDCEETLQAIEFANLQLLEFRHIDNRLDVSLAAAARTIQSRQRWYIPFWRLHARPLRVVGELKVEATGLFERTGNVLKLVGEPYLARVYRLLATRFHLETWEENIRRKLEVAEGVYQVASDQASVYRAEFLESVVVILILVEVVFTLFRH